MLAILATSALAGCKILPIAREGEATTSKFSGKDVVDKMWPAEVVPTVAEHAVPIGKVLDAVAVDLSAAGKELGHRPAEEGSPWSFIVKGEAVVREKNTQSRAGTILVDIATAKGPVTVTIQIGPVVKGNSLRDAMPFIVFQNFTNQIEFAEVGRAFNDRAMTEIAAAREAIAAGDTIVFAGAFSLNSATDKVMLTPVSLAKGGA
jgi:predicted lipoprotein